MSIPEPHQRRKPDKAMTIRLSEDDQDAITQIKTRYGIRYDAEAIRLALRLATADGHAAHTYH